MYADVAEPPAPVILLFIRSRSGLSNSVIEIPQSTHSCPTRRDSTTRLWQLQGCYVEIAGLPAAFGMTTWYSTRAYRPLSTLLGHSASHSEMLFLPHTCRSQYPSGPAQSRGKRTFANAVANGEIVESRRVRALKHYFGTADQCGAEKLEENPHRRW
jgi:hypothetical protein